MVRCFALVGMGVAGMLLAAPGASAAEKPNIIFFLADDAGYADVGCFGQTKIRTPNIDRLAAEGMRFTQHYAGSAVCAPSRCVLMTGKHPGHAIVRTNYPMKPEGQYPLPPDTVTIARLLQQQGYVTGGFGKWGLGVVGTGGEACKQGFDRFFGYYCQKAAHNYYPTYLWDNDRRVKLDNPDLPAEAKLPAGADPNDPANYRQFTGKEYSPDVIMEQARRFVRENKDKPFFLYVPTTLPHVALQVPEDSLAEYRGKWPDPPFAGKHEFPPTFAPRAAYAAMITRMDRELGRLVQLVSELGLDRRTIFIFTSDNGPMYHEYGIDSEFFQSAGPLRGMKASLYEGGIREPLVVRWPGHVAAGTSCDRVTGFEDWLPTLMEIAGATQAVPRDIDGISFAPVLRGATMPERPFFYREFPSAGGQQLVRIGDWVGVRQHMAPRGKKGKAVLKTELYNVKEDIGQKHDVAGEHPEIIEQIERVMRQQHTPSKQFPLPGVDKS